MLFNSYEFLLYFLPAVAGVFFALGHFGRAKAAAAWLALVSIIFYGYWQALFTLLLLGSIAWNYCLGSAINRAHRNGRAASAWTLMWLAVVVDLAVLAYFKYFNFFIDTLAFVASWHLDVARIVLPIGISFFTFTQIAYIVDTTERKVTEADPVHYILFVTYFPHLIAGPVLHHAEMMPQFALRNTYFPSIENLALGSFIFCIGLGKKVLLADGVQPFVAPVFEPSSGEVLVGVEAWGGALAYTFQLYFDFSGYSDMAIGLSKLFNVHLPLNFNSPYRSHTIVEFWRRWHMTLSRFLRDYLYIRLGGNRFGAPRRYFSLMSTMILGGLWHGAGWQFVIWGGLHGVYLVINHAWARFGLYSQIERSGSRIGMRLYGLASWLTTFLAVVFAWVFFRAHSVEQAIPVLEAMIGRNGWLPATYDLAGATPWSSGRFDGARQSLWLVGLAVVAFVMPNSQQLAAKLDDWMRSGVRRLSLFRAGVVLGLTLVLVSISAMINGSHGASEFIYFNF